MTVCGLAHTVIISTLSPFPEVTLLMRPHPLPVLLACLLALSLSGCGGEPTDAPSTAAPTPSSPGETAETAFSLPYYPSASLHPITGDNRSNLIVSSLLYEALFTLDETFTPQPQLAVSCATGDGLTHIVTLRDGAIFSDGSPLTAQDAAASLELARTSSLYAARLSIVTSVRAEGNQVILTTSIPHGDLSQLLDIPVVSSAGGDTPLGSGPYLLSRTEEGPVLLPNPHWRDNGQQPFSQVGLYPITELDMLVSGFDSRDISMVSTDLTGSNTLGFSGGFDIWDYPTTVMQYVGFNTVSGVCRDAAFRSALARSFDRTSVVSSLLAHHAQAAALPLSPASPLYDQELADAFTADSQLSQLLADAGFSLGEDGILSQGRSPVRLTFIVNSDNSFRVSVARYLADRLEEAGIQVSLEELSWEDYTRALSRRDFDLYLAEVRLTADFDLAALVSSGGSLNYGGWADQETNALVNAFRASAAPDRAQAASALCRHLLEQAPISPIAFKSYSVLTHWGAFSAPVITQSSLFSDLTGWTASGDSE